MGFGLLDLKEGDLYEARRYDCSGCDGLHEVGRRVGSLLVPKFRRYCIMCSRRTTWRYLETSARRFVPLTPEQDRWLRQRPEKIQEFFASR